MSSAVAKWMQPLMLLGALLLGCVTPQVILAQQPTTPSNRSEWFRPEADPKALQAILEAGHISDRWIYHDLDVARREAQQSGKPLLVVFRCVPCGSAPGLDGAVCTAGGEEASQFEAEIRAAGGDLDALLERFVAVRMVKMNGVNRHVFQFDRDVPYVAMFLNADGTVYGRYGTRVSQDRKNLPRHNLTSFQQALRRALALHADYPQNKKQLLTKRGPTADTPWAEDLPQFRPFPAEHNPKVQNCIHCHTVGETEKRVALAADPLALREIWPYPLPENIGLRLDIQDGLKIQTVRENSPAAQAGLKSGDELLSLANQPLTAEADLQWALHHAPDEGSLPIEVRRGEQTIEAKLALRGEWRKSDGHWRASLGPLRPNFELRPEPSREKKGSQPGQMGLAITYPRDAAAKAGLRNGDLLVAVDGRTDLHLEADVLKYLHVDQRAAKSVELTIIRSGAKSKITLPLR